jgi:PAS domain-containing protein
MTSACQLLGYERDELIGKQIIDIIPPRDWPRLVKFKASPLQANTRVEFPLMVASLEMRESNTLPANTTDLSQWQILSELAKPIATLVGRSCHV